MIRGGHLDVCVLGAMQVSQHGDLANWSTGAPDAVPAVGGAMDLVAGVDTIFVISRHVTKHGEPKLVERCSYPLTGQRVVSRVFTDLAVVDVSDEGFRLVELAPGVSFDEVRDKTGAPLLPPAR
jgi:3-oxoadipate CoA-transferase beta subunit